MKDLHAFGLFLGLVLSVLQSSDVLARELISAQREPGRSYKEYLHSQPLYVRPEWGRSVEGVSSRFTAESFKKHADQLDLTNHTYFQFQRSYEWIRDLRFLSIDKHPEFLRRITWQYPDDGCFTRAEMAIRKLKENGFSGLKKIFAFGDLKVQTANSAKGEVYWWFHVAPVVKVNFEYYVIDPSVSPSRILTVKDWLRAMGQDFENVRLSICHESSYDPAATCFDEDYLPDEEVLAHQRAYLHKEWFRMVELGRDPEVVLGDFPPWGGVLIEEPNLP